MALEKLYETPAGVSPSIIVYRNKPDQLFVQFLEEGMSVFDFTVDDDLLHRNDMIVCMILKKMLISCLPQPKERLLNLPETG